jgi:D-3-phosphoglycerate dehydrogenase
MKGAIRMKILVTPTSMQPGREIKALDGLKEITQDIVYNTTGKPLAEDDLIEMLKDCDGYIAGLDFITKKVMDKCPKLKVISRYGAGYDRVDIAAAKEKGIIVTNTPGVNAEAVGELAFGLMQSIARNIPYLNNQTKDGEWTRSTGIELKGKTIGILGLGAIGRVVARCAKGYDMNLIAYDPYINSAYCKKNNIGVGTFDEVISQSNFISLHIPLNEQTKHIINKENIAKMKAGVIIINTSRGGIVDENAAYQALKSKKIGGLGLDAFEEEPPEKSPLFGLDNVVVTPHTGAHTKEATDNMAYLSVKNLIDIVKGRECPYVVNQ